MKFWVPVFAAAQKKGGEMGWGGLNGDEPSKTKQIGLKIKLLYIFILGQNFRNWTWQKKGGDMQQMIHLYLT
jgi:hypothetical protein